MDRNFRGEKEEGTYRAGRLHPRLAIDLHWEALPRTDDDVGTLRQPPTGSAQSRLHLSHVEAVFQPDHFDQSIANICRQNRPESGISSQGTGQKLDDILRQLKIGLPCKATLRSTKLKLLLDNSLSLSCSLRRLSCWRVRFFTEESPHRLVPPCE